MNEDTNPNPKFKIYNFFNVLFTFNPKLFSSLIDTSFIVDYNKTMRLSEETKDRIIEYAKKHFGENCKIYLFGSRVHDDKKGGDIDLFVETFKKSSIEIQMNFLRDIYKNVTQRKIDLIVKDPLNKEKTIYYTAKKEGILLC